MSAFIVNWACINCIVTHLNLHAQRFGWLASELGYDVSRRADLDRLARALFAMNCRAVDHRYGPGTASQDMADVPAIGYRHVMRSAPAVYKAACCLQYQCIEGDVPETPLFKGLENIMRQIADRIVTDLPEFETASWGD